MLNEAWLYCEASSKSLFRVKTASFGFIVIGHLMCFSLEANSLVEFEKNQGLSEKGAISCCDSTETSAILTLIEPSTLNPKPEPKPIPVPEPVPTPMPEPEPVPVPEPEPTPTPLPITPNLVDVRVYINGELQSSILTSEKTRELTEHFILECCEVYKTTNTQFIELVNFGQQDIWISSIHENSQVVSTDILYQQKLNPGERIRYGVSYSPRNDSKSFNQETYDHINFRLYTINPLMNTVSVQATQTIKLNLATEFDLDCRDFKNLVLGSWYSKARGESKSQVFEIYENGVGYSIDSNSVIGWSVVATDEALNNSAFSAGCVLQVTGYKEEFSNDLVRTSLMTSPEEIRVYSSSDRTTELIRYYR